MRLIDADKLHKHISDLMLSECLSINIAEMFHVIIDDAQTVDPIKHGKWKYYNYSDLTNPYCGYIECSICKQHEHIVHKFCPNCGAKMRGEE